ncbi:60S ribosomal protein L20, putative [Theileria equi strain WA]|uniref:60S ribosomal protein L20, putative n=1 Tax=Theileria equi strain WA TaxID=1537102 RepID=L0AW81_THEEQ|nr:60S ribosomal protein L20, putative [Theileria equi strain WA]AFZ79286.1 60S ribosomal protein L20, putative [Theileria equi strain WA]|eukprot:XP_004828952.1 60S ribosomal protein L20, putative [Theileria equi strain WA]
MKIPRQIVYELARGFRGRSKRCIKLSSTRVAKALQHSFTSRRNRQKYIRVHWISTINRAAREWNMIYSRFMGSLNSMNCWLSRKSLYILSLNEPVTFKSIVDECKYARSEPKTKVRDISNL